MYYGWQADLAGLEPHARALDHYVRSEQKLGQV